MPELVCSYFSVEFRSPSNDFEMILLLVIVQLTFESSTHSGDLIGAKRYTPIAKENDRLIRNFHAFRHAWHHNGFLDRLKIMR